MTQSLFSPGKIGTLELPNRMIRAASHEALATAEGAPTEEQFKFYEGFVHGGIGMIITGYAGIMQQGKSALHHMTMIDNDELIPAHRELTGKIHAIGGRICLQIAHCGRQTWSRDTGDAPLRAPSPIACGFYQEQPRAMSEAEIGDVINAFAAAAKRARDAGYDAIQIHGAHGYLLSTFLSRSSNKRRDQWGGSLENRFRIVGETLKAVREAVGPDFPVLIKLNGHEQPKDGITPEECAQIGKLVEETGCCDAIEISQGANQEGFTMARGEFPTEAILNFMRPYRDFGKIVKFLVRHIAGPVVALFQPRFTQGYNLDAAILMKNAVKIPVITLGGMRTKPFMEDAIESGKTDFVSMARPLILEPDLPRKFESGESSTARCNNCNRCVVAVDMARIYCYNEKLNPETVTSTAMGI